jgi:GWxTD domain-containing protein
MKTLRAPRMKDAVMSPRPVSQPRIGAGATLLLPPLLLAVLLGMAAAAAEPAAPVPEIGAALCPGLGRGDFDFEVDVAGLRPAAAGKVVTRVLVQFPVRRLLEQTDANQADLDLQVRVYDAEKALAALAQMEKEDVDLRVSEPAPARQAAAESDQDVQSLLADFEGVTTAASGESRVAVEAADRQKLRETDYRLGELSLEVAPGDWVFEIAVENLSKSKKGLLDRLRKRHMNATARMLVRIPDLHAETALADPVFQVGHGSHQEYATRVYGLLNDSLHVRGAVFGNGPTRIDLAARDRDGAVRWRDSLQVDVSGSREIGFHTSVNALPAGQYLLQLSATTPQGTVAAQRSFDVAWSLRSWSKSQRDLELEAQIVLTEGEFKQYAALPVGEKERYLDDFWRKFDPTPETAYNEIREEFLRRVAYADMHFSGLMRGALTHQGKIYIRLGPPQEVQAEAVPSQLAGTGSEGLIEKVEDPYSSADEEAAGSSKSFGASLQDRPERIRLHSEHERVIGQAHELISYELWIYAGHGTPLLPRDVLGIDTGFRLLFADTQGTGEYELRKSSVQLDIPGLHANY